LNSLCVVGLVLLTQTFDRLFSVGWDLVSEIPIVGWTGFASLRRLNWGV
jgi:hypothetical protein